VGGLTAAVITYEIGGTSYRPALLMGIPIAWLRYLHNIVTADRFLFDLNDAELVRVSAIANHAEEKLAELDYKLQEAEARIVSLEAELK
jgi:hypothetical protein